jgi:hypothetical protein
VCGFVWKRVIGTDVNPARRLRTIRREEVRAPIVLSINLIVKPLLWNSICRKKATRLNHVIRGRSPILVNQNAFLKSVIKKKENKI